MSKYTAERVLEVSTALHRAAHSNGARTAEAVEMLDYLAEMLAKPAESNSELHAIMERDAWRAAIIGLCIGSESEFATPDKAAEHLRNRLAKPVAQGDPLLDSAIVEWMDARGILPDTEEDGSIDMREVIEALDNHEHELLAAKPAAQGEAVAELCRDEYYGKDHPEFDIMVFDRNLPDGTKLYNNPIAVAGTLRDQPED